MFRKFLRNYGSQSSIHGFRHLFAARNYHYSERIIWSIFILAAIFGILNTSSKVLNRYQTNPTVISIERDHISWNTSFPAVTLCPHNKIDEKLLENYSSTSTVKDKDKLRQFLTTLINASYHNFETVVNFTEIPARAYMDVLRKIGYKFKYILSGNRGASNIHAHEVITEMGICYTFNSQLAIYNTFKYWKRGNWVSVEQNKSLDINVLDGEVFANLNNMSTGFDLYIHGPYEVPDIATQILKSSYGYTLQLYLTASSLFSSDNVRALRVEQRKCRFHYESNLRHSPAYSYVLCRIECRVSLAKKLCGCVPHFYRRLDGERVCNVEGLHCLAKHKGPEFRLLFNVLIVEHPVDRFLLLKGECNCLPNCDEVNYVIDEVDSREWILGSNVRWGLKVYPKMRLRRDVIFGFSTLLVYVGGMAGLFLGCSVLSFVEIVYFFTLRFYWFVRRDSAKKT